MKKKYKDLLEEIDLLKENNLIRKSRVFATSQKAISKVNGKDVLVFSSSNYLSYAQINELEELFSKVKELGAGSGGSRLTTGNNIYHELLEEKLAKFFDYDKALLFNSGYCANTGVLSALGNKDTEIFSDEKNHASIIDGCVLSKSKITVYKHLDMKDLEDKLKASKYIRKIIISDGVFSMDGDILDLPKFCSLGEEYDAISIVDDAHGLGVIGENGKGIVEYFGNKIAPDVLIGTLSKAISVEGGYACSNAIINTLLFNKARSFIFSTSLSPIVTYSSFKALERLEKDNTSVVKLQENINYIIDKLEKMGITIKYKTAIIPIKIGSESKAMDIGNKLLEEGILVSPIRYPAVPKGEAILRVTLMAEHSKDQIDTLLTSLKKYL